MTGFEPDIEQALQVLLNGGLILYPTDTIWGIGCDATNKEAVKRVYDLKKREDSKAMIVLVADKEEISRYTENPSPAVFQYLKTTVKPTTVIYPGARGFAPNLVAADGSIGIRICHEPFCQTLINKLKRPLVSTSANLSGEPPPGWFGEVSEAIKSGVDYIVNYRQDDRNPSLPSSVVKVVEEGVVVLRP